jgi:hypothetical protein
MMILAMAAAFAGATPPQDQASRRQLEATCLREVARTFAEGRPATARFYDVAWTRGRDGWRLDYAAEVTDRAGRATGVTGRCRPAPAQEVAARSAGR